MGGGSYSIDSRNTRAKAMNYHSNSIHENFTASGMHEGMNPKGVTIRESRDSLEHPNSLAIIIAMDQTGSMGYMPQELVKDGLPHIMTTIIGAGIPDPQVMFCAIGDAHNHERSPFQISQFESSDEKLDFWLTKVHLEGNGGGNGGEDYSFAHHFAAHHTSIDCFEKRGEKGFLFTIGDDKPHSSITSAMFKGYLDKGDLSEQTDEQMIKEAQKLYNVYHIHVGRNEASHNVKRRWTQLLGENFVDCPDFTQAPQVIADIIAANAVKHSQESISLTPTSPGQSGISL